MDEIHKLEENFRPIKFQTTFPKSNGEQCILTAALLSTEVKELKRIVKWRTERLYE